MIFSIVFGNFEGSMFYLVGMTLVVPPVSMGAWGSAPEIFWTRVDMLDSIPTENSNGIAVV